MLVARKITCSDDNGQASMVIILLGGFLSDPKIYLLESFDDDIIINLFSRSS